MTKQVSEDEKEWLVHIQEMGQSLLDLFDEIGRETTVGGSSRELALAKTNLEQAVMWAAKHITKEPS